MFTGTIHGAIAQEAIMLLRLRELHHWMIEYSIFLMIGLLAALFFANSNPEAYHHFLEYELFPSTWLGIGHAHGDGTYGVTIHYLVSDFLMAFFFALAAQEVRLATNLRDGALRGTKALTPIGAAIGGILGPIGVFLFLGTIVFDASSLWQPGWPIPTATDIAFALVAATFILGKGHPAILFLLVLAITDDVIGMIIIAVFFSDQVDLRPLLMYSGSATLTTWFLFYQLPLLLDKSIKGQTYSNWVRSMNQYIWWHPRLILACISWYGFAKAGIHPTLGFIPIILVIDHREQQFGENHVAFNSLDLVKDRYHNFSQWVLGLFALTNAGVAVSEIGPMTWVILAALLIGKPFGIWAGAQLVGNFFRCGLPEGVGSAELWVTGCLGAIGLTVALFMSHLSLAHNPLQGAASLGAILSLPCAVMLAYVAKKKLLPAP